MMHSQSVAESDRHKFRMAKRAMMIRATKGQVEYTSINEAKKSQEATNFLKAMGGKQPVTPRLDAAVPKRTFEKEAAEWRRSMRAWYSVIVEWRLVVTDQRADD